MVGRFVVVDAVDVVVVVVCLVVVVVVVDNVVVVVIVVGCTVVVVVVVVGRFVGSNIVEWNFVLVARSVVVAVDEVSACGGNIDVADPVNIADSVVFIPG